MLSPLSITNYLLMLIETMKDGRLLMTLTSANELKNAVIAK